MTIKYYSVPEKKTTYAILGGTRYDAIVKIDKAMSSTKSLCFNPEKYLMPNSFRVAVVCDDQDVWDADKGKSIAKKRLLDRYYNVLDKKMASFIKDLALAVAEVDRRF